MPGLLYPAYQKLYSALSSLDRFDKEADFFDNIACIDRFFSEYRNVSFVIQSQLRHTPFIDAYESNKKILDHWFVDKRNETSKQTPFQLIKTISITVYYPNYSSVVFKQSFSVENDDPLDRIIEKVREVFLKTDSPEIFFSASFCFQEKDKEVDLFEKLFDGISSMLLFMDAMDRAIGERCDLCQQLKDRLGELAIIRIPRDFLLVNDYVYYKKTASFEKGSRFAIGFPNNSNKVADHSPLNEWRNARAFQYDGTVFGNFTFMHATIRCMHPKAEIMPAIMVIYEDDTYDLDAFHSEIKTTFYRKVNEVAEIVETQKVKEVCFTCLYALVHYDKNVEINSKDRVKSSNKDVLICASIDSEMKEKEYVFDGENLVPVMDLSPSGMKLNGLLEVFRN